ncbi:MAG TPA: DUF502 domain-containing protein [Bacteroidia bacterium]|nr:DUF502 domain-containing protein [Bacteroidia bacterium]
MKKIINYFLQGLLFVVPIVVTIYVLYQLIYWIDNLLPFLDKLNIPGLGLIAIFVLISAAGYIGSRLVRNPIKAYMEHLMERAPLVKLIYTSVKDLIAAFVGEKKSFNQPVAVKLEKNSDTERIGFITRNDVNNLGFGSEKVAVYLPFSYSFMGELVILPRENVRKLDASGPDMIKFVISGGVGEV